MGQYESFVRCTLEAALFELDEEYGAAGRVRRKQIEAEKANVLANHADFVAIASQLPQVPERLNHVIFPRKKKDRIYLEATPENVAEMREVLELFVPYPLAHFEGKREVFPWDPEIESHRIFPYMIHVQIRPTVRCRLEWCHGRRLSSVVWIRMLLPPLLGALSADRETGAVSNAVFIEGMAPYTYQKAGSKKATVTIHYPRAYKSTDGGPGRLLKWTDIPLFNLSSAEIDEANRTLLKTEKQGEAPAADPIEENSAGAAALSPPTPKNPKLEILAHFSSAPKVGAMGTHRYSGLPATAEDALSDKGLVVKIATGLQESGRLLEEVVEILLYEPRSDYRLVLSWDLVSEAISRNGIEPESPR